MARAANRQSNNGGPIFPGLAFGIAATLLSAVLALFFFVSPSLSFIVEDSPSLLTMGMFLAMGMLFSLGHQRLRDAAPPGVEVAPAEPVGPGGFTTNPADLTNSARQARHPSPEPDGMPDKGDGLVLVVEDNRDMSAHIVDILRPHHPVGDGAAALEALRAERFDAVLMDAQMPVMDGLRATAAIRQATDLPGGPGVPVIALTACAMEGDRERLLAAGMDEYIEKPVDAQALRRALARLVDAPVGEVEPVEKVGPA